MFSDSKKKLTGEPDSAVVQVTPDMLPPHMLGSNEWMGSCNCLFAFTNNNSPSRAAMDASHLPQAVVLNTPDIQMISSGADREYAKTLFDIKLDGTEGGMVQVIKIIDKYRRAGDNYTLRDNPETHVFYIDLSTDEVRVAVVPTYYYHHMYFGFRYIRTKVCNNLREGYEYPANTILATSPQANLEHGTYMPGVEAITAMGSFPGVVEDGIIISESFANRASSRRYGTISVNFGRDAYPLNLYGDDKNYQIFPEIGECIRKDGILMALRDRDLDPDDDGSDLHDAVSLNAPIAMTPKALREVDPYGDKIYYGISGAKVIDVTVYHGHDSAVRHMPSGMGDQPKRYFENKRDFYDDELMQFYDVLARSGRKLSHPLHRLITKTLQLSHKHLQKRNRVTYRREPLQEWRVTITYEIIEPIRQGHKLTCLSAGKGVVCDILPDHLMPLDKYGRRVEVLIDDNSTIHRMNTGRLWSSELAEYIVQQRRYIQDQLVLTNNIEQTFDELLRLYKVASPWYHNIIANGITDVPSKHHHINEFIEGKCNLVIPYGSLAVGSVHSKAMAEQYKLDYDTVTLFEPDGTPVQSKDKFLISPLYMIRLEKINADWSASTIPYRQLHGVIAKLSSDIKYQLPYRNQAVRFLGETEVRLLMAAISPSIVSAMLRMANNSDLCVEMIRRIITADNPSLIPETIPYNELHKYPSTIIERIQHVYHAMGAGYEYINESPLSDIVLDPLQVDVENDDYIPEGDN